MGFGEENRWRLSFPGSAGVIKSKHTLNHPRLPENALYFPAVFFCHFREFIKVFLYLYKNIYYVLNKNVKFS